MPLGALSLRFPLEGNSVSPWQLRPRLPFGQENFNYFPNCGFHGANLPSFPVLSPHLLEFLPHFPGPVAVLPLFLRLVMIVALVSITATLEALLCHINSAPYCLHHQNPLEGLLKHRVLGPLPGAPESVGPGQGPSIWLSFLFFFFCMFLNLFYLFLAALSLHGYAWAFSSCRERGLLLVEVHRLLIAVASLVAEHGL